jgi:hypothetical protein
MKAILTILLLMLGSVVFSQSVFVVQNDGSPSAHQTLDSALYYAVDGDYIYMPGGTFNVGSVRITKNLNIIGAGHYPDSTQATGRTVLTGDVYFKTGADGSTLQGLYLNGDIYMGETSSTGDVQNIHISRSNVNNIYLTSSTSGSTNYGAQNIFIKDCIVRTALKGANTQGVIVETSILNYIAYFDGNAEFRNNIFLKQGTSSSSDYCVMYRVDNCTFNNNIFKNSATAGHFAYLCNDNTFNNNIFNMATCYGGSCFNCLYSIDFYAQFVDVPLNSFDYTYDFHLSDTSVAIGAGLVGTDCGIYGGDNPYKEAAVPVNPHIQFKQIPSATDSQGKLNIQVKVRAQDN